MSIQCKVELKDIPEHWEKRYYPVHDYDSYYDTYVQTGEELHVKFPESGWCISYSSVHLIFDCGRVNKQFIAELEHNTIPYSLG